MGRCKESGKEIVVSLTSFYSTKFSQKLNAPRSWIPSTPFTGGSFGKWSERPVANWGKRPIPPERFFCLLYAA